MDADAVWFRLSKENVDVSWGDAQELVHRLDKAGASSAADAIRNRAPAGVLLTPNQKVEVWNVIHDWIGEAAGVAGLGTVYGLREAIELETPEIGRPDPPH